MQRDEGVFGIKGFFGSRRHSPLSLSAEFPLSWEPQETQCIPGMRLSPCRHLSSCPLETSALLWGVAGWLGNRGTCLPNLFGLPQSLEAPRLT